MIARIGHCILQIHFSIGVAGGTRLLQLLLDAVETGFRIGDLVRDRGSRRLNLLGAGVLHLIGCRAGALVGFLGPVLCFFASCFFSRQLFLETGSLVFGVFRQCFLNQLRCFYRRLFVFDNQTAVVFEFVDRIFRIFGAGSGWLVFIFVDNGFHGTRHKTLLGSLLRWG